MQPENPGISIALARLAGEGMDAELIAIQAISVWGAIDDGLSPIIGKGGVAALYKRSLYLTRGEHPCLAGVYETSSAAGEYLTLQSALAQQTTTQALAALHALLTTFHELLTHLIGESLTERLLRSVWDTHSSGKAVQDHSS